MEQQYEYEFGDRFGAPGFWSVIAPSRAAAIRKLEADYGVLEVGVTELPTSREPVRCLDWRPDDYLGECDGELRYRESLSGTGRSFVRCDRHWGRRLAEQEKIDDRYPDSPIPPPGFDPAYAGERWNEDD